MKLKYSYLTTVASLILAGIISFTSGIANAQSAAQKAVDAAKKMCNGKTITIVWEAGLQSLDQKFLWADVGKTNYLQDKCYRGVNRRYVHKDYARVSSGNRCL